MAKKSSGTKTKKKEMSSPFKVEVMIGAFIYGTYYEKGSIVEVTEEFLQRVTREKDYRFKAL